AVESSTLRRGRHFVRLLCARTAASSVLGIASAASLACRPPHQRCVATVVNAANASPKRIASAQSHHGSPTATVMEIGVPPIATCPLYDPVALAPSMSSGTLA